MAMAEDPASRECMRRNQVLGARHAQKGEIRLLTTFAPLG
jgi:hypothetical protein